MAEAIFTLSADIVPQLDQRQIQAQAQQLAKQLNTAMAQNIKPVAVGIDQKNFSGATQAFNKELSKIQRNAEKLNKEFDGTKSALDKATSAITSAGGAATNVLSRASKAIQEFASKGFDKITAQIEKVSPSVSRVFNAAKVKVQEFAETARTAFLRLTDFINITNTHLILFSGSIRDAIRNNSLFKKSFDDVKRTAGGIKNLTTDFKVLNSQIQSGTSAVQLQAKAGDKASQQTAALLNPLVAIQKQLEQVGVATQQTAINISKMVGALTPVGTQGKASLSLINREVHNLDDAFKRLAATAGKGTQKSREILETFAEASPQGLRATIDAMKEVAKQTPTFTRSFTTANGEVLKETVNLRKEVRRNLLDMFPEDLSGFQRFRTRFGLFFDSAKGLFKDLKAGFASAIQFRGQDTFLNNFTSGIEIARKKVQDLKDRTREAFETSGFKGKAAITKPGVEETGTPLDALDPAKLKVKAAEAGRIMVLAINQAIKDGFRIDIDLGKIRAQGVAIGKALSDGINSATSVATPKVFEKVQNRDAQGRFAKGTTLKEVITPAPDLAKIKAEGKAVADTFKKAVEEPLKTFLLPTPKTKFDPKLGHDLGKDFTANFRKGVGADSLGVGKNLLTGFGINQGNFQNEGLKSGKGLISGLLKGIGTGGGKAAALPINAVGAAAKTAIVPVQALGATLLRAIGPALGIAAGAGAIAAVIGFGKAALDAAAKFQRLGIALDGVFGEGSNALNTFADFAAITPFQLEDITTAGIKLASVFENINPQGALAITEAIAGAAAASGNFSGDTVNRVILAITQIQSLGKVTSDNLRQITEALPGLSKANIFKQVAKDLNVTNDEAKKLATEGLLDSTVGIQAIVTAANQVPGAAAALEKQAESFDGLLSTTKDLTTQILATIGQPILKEAVEILKGINVVLGGINEKLRAGDGNWGKLVKNLGYVVSGAGPILFLLKKIGSTFGEAGKAGAESTGKMTGGIEAARRAIDPLLRNIDALKEATGFDGLTESIQSVTEALTAETTKVQNAEIEQIKKVLAVKGAFDAQAAAAKNVTKAQEALNEAIEAHNKELADKQIKLSKELVAANDDLAASTERVKKAELELQKILKGASALDLEKADLSLASAKLRLRQLIEDEKKALDELNKSQKVAVDLSGLSLDQIKSRLSSVRASLQAQKTGASALSKEKKTQEQLTIDALEKGITRRQTEIDILDAETAVQELRNKGKESDPEVIAARQTIRDAEKERAKHLENQEKIQTEINALSLVDLEWTKQRKGLEEAITEAKKAQVEANREVNLKIAEAKNDLAAQIGILRAQVTETPGLGVIWDTVAGKIDLAREKLAKVRSEGNAAIAEATARLNKLQDAVQATLNAAPALQGTAPQFLTGGLLGVGSDAFNSVITGSSEGAALLAAARALEEAAKRSEETDRRLEDFARVNGFAEGGVINSPTKALIGEAGREAVLPLTRPGRLLQILGNKAVLPPVLAALEKLHLPGFGAPRLDKIKLSSADSPSIAFQAAPPQRGSSLLTKQEQSKKDASLARAIVAEMKAAGFTTGKQVQVNNDFTAPDPRDALSGIKIKQIAREVKKQIEKDY